MDNKLNTEPELGQHEETNQETPPGQTPETPETPPAPQEADPLKKLQDELAEAKDKYVRLYAEFENHRRRTAKEKLEMILGANEQLLKNLLPVLDDFERAEKSFKESRTEKELEGFVLIKNKFAKILEQYGVKTMDATGKDFNADLHEAIAHAPAPEANLKGKVLEVVEKGYTLNDKVIRFAKVVVAS